VPVGIELRPFVSAAVGATAFSTGLAIFRSGSYLPYHTHSVSEAITVVQGSLRVSVEGRTYLANEKDCVHVPAGIAHSVGNAASDDEAIAHTAFGSSEVTRQAVEREFATEERADGLSRESDPETVVRFRQSEVYELSTGAFFIDLFARRLGAVGICGGYSRFLPGASLPCHIHDFDESITIVEGAATCLVQGRRYQLSGFSTAYIPKGLAHRFINESDQPMAMIRVYAGDEPDRRVVDAGYCSGELVWPGAQDK
jgi:quercetin dioxygenase-like cupin family protein